MDEVYSVYSMSNPHAVPTLCQLPRAIISMVLNISVAQQMLDALLYLGDGLAQAFSQEACTLAKAVHDTTRSAIMDYLDIWHNR